ARRFARSARSIVRGRPSWGTSISSTGSTPLAANTAPTSRGSARSVSAIAPAWSLRICTAANPCSAANRISCSGGRQLSGKNRPSIPMRTWSGRCALPLDDELCDLDRVERGALPQVVAREEEREAVLDRRIAAEAAHEHVIDARRLPRRREVLDTHGRRRGEELARALRR